jgi:UDP-glucose 4-epimerase
MRLLVTGASGFIGKNLLLQIPKKWEVTATYNKSKDFIQFLRENALDNIQAIKVNLSHKLETKRKISGKFDCVVHLAANTNVALSVQNPEADLRQNVNTLLNTVKTAQIRDLIFMSSGAVYDGNIGPVSPKCRLNPSLPYAISKLTCEHYVTHFKKHKLIDNYVILRFFGAYGPYEPPTKIFSRLIKTFYIEDKQEFTIIGDGNNLIDAMYVEDAIRGIILVIKSKIRNVTVDFAAGKPITINELATKVAEIFQKKRIKLKHKKWPLEYITFYTTSNEMKNLYGFNPSTPLKVGIRKLAEWLKKKSA